MSFAFIWLLARVSWAAFFMDFSDNEGSACLSSSNRWALNVDGHSIDLTIEGEVLDIGFNGMKAFCYVKGEEWSELREGLIMASHCPILLIEDRVKPQGSWNEMIVSLLQARLPYSSACLHNGHVLKIKKQARKCTLIAAGRPPPQIEEEKPVEIAQASEVAPHQSALMQRQNDPLKAVVFGLVVLVGIMILGPKGQ